MDFYDLAKKTSEHVHMPVRFLQSHHKPFAFLVAYRRLHAVGKQVALGHRDGALTLLVTTRGDRSCRNKGRQSRGRSRLTHNAIAENTKKTI